MIRKANGTREPIKANPVVALVLVASKVLTTFVRSFAAGKDRRQAGFTFADGHEYSSFRYVLWFSLLIEVPFFLLLAQIVPSLLPHRRAIELVLAGISLNALVVFRADRFGIRRTAHQLLDDGLHINMGIRVTGFIPLSAIQSVEQIPPGKWQSHAKQWKASQGSHVAKLSPMDKPNVAIHVSPGQARLSWMQGSMTYPDVIALYLDKPMEFIDAVRLKLAMCAHEAVHGQAEPHMASSLLKRYVE